MKVMQVILGLFALLTVTLQTCHYSYWLWLEPRSPALAMSGDPIARDLAQSHTLAELNAMYEDVKRKADQPQATKAPPATMNEMQLFKALEARQAYEQQVTGLYFFWWVGLGCIVGGVAFYVLIHRWLGMAFIIAGFLEMLYWVSPSWTTTGMEVEAERLLTGKLIYSALTGVILVGLWTCSVLPALARWRRPFLAPKEAAGAASGTLPPAGNGSAAAQQRWRGPERRGVALSQDSASLS